MGRNIYLRHNKMGRDLALIMVVFLASLILPAQNKGGKERHVLSDPVHISTVGAKRIVAERSLSKGNDTMLTASDAPKMEDQPLILKNEDDLSVGKPQENQNNSESEVISGELIQAVDGEHNAFQIISASSTRSDHETKLKVPESISKLKPVGNGAESENIHAKGFSESASRDPRPQSGLSSLSESWMGPELSLKETRRTQRAAARTHPPSPCPGVFSYLKEGPKGGKWYGTITVATGETIQGVTLGIQLDKPALQLGAWLGAVQTQNKKDFIVSNKEKIVKPSEPLSTKILIQFNERDLQPPRITKIMFNGMQICPARNVPSKSQTTLGSSNQEVPDEFVDGIPCGQVDPKPSPLIANAETTERGEWPWHAAIYDAKKSKLEYICGGSIIGKRTILTAAHCVSVYKGRKDVAVASELRVVSLGKYLLNVQEEDVQVKEVEKIILHPEYSSQRFQSDIAILMLSSPLEFTEYVKPVCLWNGNRPTLSEIEGRDGVVIGWGYDEKGNLSESLMMGNMPVVSNQNCIWSNPQFFSVYLTDRTFCAGYRNGTSACNGDSGGGMFFPKRVPGKSDTFVFPLTWTLRGIVSLSVSQDTKKICDTNQYVIFVDVAKYYYWIKRHQHS